MVNDLGFKYTGQNQIVSKNGGGGGGQDPGARADATADEHNTIAVSTPDSKKRKSPTERTVKGESAKKAKTSAPIDEGEVEADDEES